MKHAEAKKYEISLDKVDSIEVVRSFSKTYQVEQYNPISCFASYKAVLSNPTNGDINTISNELQDKSERDVMEQIDNYTKLNTKPF